MQLVGQVMTGGALLLLVVALVVHRHRGRSFAALGGAALLLRVPGLAAGVPYVGYVDEGHVLHRSVFMLSERTLDPQWYRYGTFLAEATALVAAGYGILPGAAPVTVTGIEPQPEWYDLGMPVATVLSGRLVVLLSSLVLVLAVAWVAREVAGALAGAAAGVVAAVLPALVTRSQIVIVHTPGAAAVAVCAAACWRLVSQERAHRAAAVAGAMAGIAFTAQYVAGVVVLLVGACALVAPTWRDRSTRLAVAGASWLAAVVVTMPAWITSPRSVLRGIAEQSAIYAERVSSTRYLDTAVMLDEAGPLVVALGVAGLGVLVVRRDTRLWAGAWAGATVAALAYLASMPFQPRQTMVVLLPVLLVGCGVAVGAAAQRLRQRSWARPDVVAAALLTPVVVGAAWGGQLWDRAAEALTEAPDHRVLAVDWLVEHVSADDDVVVAEELALVASELARVPGRVEVRSADGLDDLADVEWLLVGADVAVDAVEAGVVAFEVEGRPVPDPPGFWRTNDLGLVVVDVEALLAGDLTSR